MSPGFSGFDRLKTLKGLPLLPDFSCGNKVITIALIKKKQKKQKQICLVSACFLCGFTHKNVC